jgi:hypothetical protein
MRTQSVLIGWRTAGLPLDQKGGGGCWRFHHHTLDGQGEDVSLKSGSSSRSSAAGTGTGHYGHLSLSQALQASIKG